MLAVVRGATGTALHEAGAGSQAVGTHAGVVGVSLVEVGALLRLHLEDLADLVRGRGHSLPRHGLTLAPALVQEVLAARPGSLVVAASAELTAASLLRLFYCMSLERLTLIATLGQKVLCFSLEELGKQGLIHARDLFVARQLPRQISHPPSDSLHGASRELALLGR